MHDRRLWQVTMAEQWDYWMSEDVDENKQLRWSQQKGSEEPSLDTAERQSH